MRKILLGASSLFLSTLALGNPPANQPFYELPPAPKRPVVFNLNTFSDLSSESKSTFGFNFGLLTSPQVPAIPNDHPNACNPLGPQRIAVILASYPGAPSDSAIPSADYIRELFNGVDSQGVPLNFSVTDYYATVSNQKTTLQSVKVVGPYQAPKAFSVDMSDPNNKYRGLDDWEASLLALASHDVDLMNTDRVVFVSPEAIDTTGAPIAMGAGLSAQGVCDLDYTGVEGHRTFAHSWVRSGPNYKGVDITTLESQPGMLSPPQLLAAIRRQNMLDMAPLTHELGHTFNLGHANTIKRPQAGFSPPDNDETLPAQDQNLYEIEYGDPLSVMSANSMQWLNAAHLSQLGWFDPSEIQLVQANGTFRIYPLETPGKLRAIKIPRAIKSPTDPNDISLKNSEYLWVEYRQPLGAYDTDLNMQYDRSGAFVHYTNPNQPMPDNYYPDETLLLNFAPSGPINPYQTDLTLKTSWKDPHSMVSLQVVQITPQFIDINVEFNQ
jgi:hypothetical protein